MNLIIKDINIPLEPGNYNATLQIDEDGAAHIPLLVHRRWL